MEQDRIDPNKDNSRQMALDLPVRDMRSRDDLIVGKANILAVELIDAWPQWPGNVVVLAGPVGSGKSHIAGIWAEKSNARCMQMSRISELAEDRNNVRALLLEDADSGAINDTQLFHILNAKRSTNTSVLITSRNWPENWGIELADLSSRIRAAQLVEISEPEDELLRRILVKLFADRQLNADPKLIDYLVIRMERSLAAANVLVKKLDQEALANKRKINRALAGEILAQIEVETSSI